MDQFYGKTHGLVPADDVASQRTARDSLFLMAQFRLFGQKDEVQVRVRNLSAGGLMAEVPEALAIGTPVEVEVRGIGWVLGRIAWAASASRSSTRSIRAWRASPSAAAPRPPSSSSRYCPFADCRYRRRPG